MRKNRSHMEDPSAEPLGIVISGWPRAEETPRVHAYVWAPAPEEELEDDTAPLVAA